MRPEEPGDLSQTQHPTVHGWKAAHRKHLAKLLGCQAEAIDLLLARAGSANHGSALALPPDTSQAIAGLIDIHLDMAHRLSMLIGQPLTVPDQNASSVNSHPSGPDYEKDDALKIGRAVQSLIRRRIDERLAAEVARLAERVCEAVADTIDQRIPASGRWLTTKTIAKRLALAPKTVRKLCNAGLIDADKTAGGEWRTTEARLNGSDYIISSKQHRR